MSTEQPAVSASASISPSTRLTTLPAPRGKYLALLVLILGGLSAFAPLSIDMYLPSLPTIGQELQANDAQVQLTLSFCLFGLALGQLVAGPLSDALGRRRPLLIGLVAYILASLLCVVAPSIFVFAALRFLQGLAGAAGIVIARATIRDYYTGVDAARFFSLLTLISGLAPILAPILGGILLRFTSWRGVFLVLALIGTVLFFATLAGLKETLPPEKRRQGNIKETLRVFWRLLSDPSFLGYALSCGLVFSAMFAYISGSPFILQGLYGLTPLTFGIAFGVNAMGLVLISQINGRLVGRVSLKRLLTTGLVVNCCGGIALLIIVATGFLGLAGILPALFVIVSSLGLVVPNATALALSNHPDAAGSASALLGVIQYAIGASAMPLVGLAGTTTALPMALVIAGLGTTAVLTFMLFGLNRKFK